ncbi:hypothetical protein B0H13DRAFT_1888907 [Mycena leptocephala]|nr:hypothetical protein B0H13DRAFT_1888907 [Mycena leptocephala]
MSANSLMATACVGLVWQQACANRLVSMQMAWVRIRCGLQAIWLVMHDYPILLLTTVEYSASAETVLQTEAGETSKDRKDGAEEKMEDMDEMVTPGTSQRLRAGKAM